MEQALTPSEFDQAVTEYKLMHKNVLESFLNGVIKLGEILSRQRDKWKPEGKWAIYLKEIGLSESHAGVQIRTYEYSLKDKQTLIEVNAQSFRQLGKFLSLEDGKKASLAQVIQGEALSTSEFLNKIEEIVEGDILVDDISDEPIIVEEFDDSTALDVPDPEDWDFNKMLLNSKISEAPFLARQTLAGINYQGINLSENCLPILESCLYNEQSLNLLEDNLGKLSDEERKYFSKYLTFHAKKLKAFSEYCEGTLK